MGFLDVHGEEARAIPVLAVDLLNALDRAPERRSGVAAEYQDQRLRSRPVGEPHARATVERHERNVRGGMADGEIPLPTLVVAEHSVDVAGPDPPHEEERDREDSREKSDD
jgi:hypothetical protein